MRCRYLSVLLSTICLFSIVSTLQAQNSDPNNDTGIHPYEIYDGARENINLGAGNVFVSVPLLALPGRNGHDYSVSLTSNSQSWSWVQFAGGWTTGGLGMVVTHTAGIYFRPTGSVSPAPEIYCAGGYTLTDENGGAYSFPGIISACTYRGQPAPSYEVLRGSDVRGEGMMADLSSNVCKLTLKDGTSYPLQNGQPLGCPTVGFTGYGHGAPVMTDSNGNMVVSGATPSTSGQVNGGGDLFPIGSDTDTVGRRVDFINNSDTTKTIQYRDSNGLQRTITLNVQTVQLSCTFGTPGPYGQPSGSPKLITSAVLPNGLTYIFQYDECGNLVKIVYPSGGYTRYVLDYLQYTHNIDFVGGRTDIEVTQKYVCRAASVAPGDTSTGIGKTCPVAEDLTTYTPTLNQFNCNNSVNTIVDPLGNKTIYQFTGYTYCSPGPVLESQRQVYQGSSTLLRTVAKTYTDIYSYFYPTSITTTLPNGLQSQVQYDYYPTVPRGLVKEKREYGWTKTQTFTLARKTAYANYCYLKPRSEIVYNASGTQIAQTIYEFDNYTAGISASGAVMHDSSYNSNFTTGRCNVTAIQHWRNTDSAMLTTRMQYDDAGNVVSSTAPSNSPYDSLTRTTTYSYADSWSTNNTCAPTGGSAAAYPTQVTDPAGLVAKHSYNSCTGTVASSTDSNNQVSSLTYDLMDRLTQTTLPGGGQISTCFSEVAGTTCSSSSYPIKIVGTQKITSSLNKVSTTVLDGLARITQTQLNSDPDGVTYVDTVYDGAEQKSTVTNPYRSPSETTYGIATYQYDALGRPTKIIPPDGTASVNYVSTTYDVLLNSTPPTNCTVATDQTGKARKSCSDGLGRLTQVFEDPSGVNYETDYQYDLLNNLLRVDQKGTAPTDSTKWRTRTFAYNSLSQLLCSANPEMTPVTCPNPDNGSYTAGTVRYAYDNVGNLFTKTSPKPNQPSGSVTVQASYLYDKDNRVVQKSYNDGTTPTVKYGYDGIAPTGCTPAPPSLVDSFPAGRRTSMCDGSGATSWKHDEMGRTLQDKRKIGSTSALSVIYAYNLDGSIKTLKYPSTNTVKYTPSGAGRLTAAQDVANSVNYVQNAHYAPFGGLTSITQGAAPITTTNAYSKRLQPILLSASTPTATIMRLCYDFHLGVAVNTSPCSFSGYTSGNNGNVYQIVNNRSGNRTQNFIYDSLNRIQQAWTNGSNWGETFGPTATNPGVPPSTPGIDAWGNLTQRSGVLTKTLYEPLSCQVDGQNHLTTCSVGYDAAGNTISYNAATYTYDAENRLTATAGVTYTYDGDGKRVKKSNGTLYWTGMGSDTLAESDLAGTMQKDYIFFNGKRVARRDLPGTPSVKYYFSDHLGSAGVITNDVGTMSPPLEESDYYPYGGEIPITNGDPNAYKFTGKERDTETGLDYFGARYFGSNMGRFTSADPLYIESKRLRDPQRLNLYTYVRNNPLQYIDPVGLDIAIKCEQQQDCKTAEQQINNRQGTLLSVSDKNGLLTVQQTAAGPLTPQDQALADAINDPNNHGTLTVVNDSGSVTFGKTSEFGPGQNSVDVADTAKLGSPLTPGNAVAHEALESYLTGSGKSFADAHGRATDLFGGLGPARGGFTYNADGDVSGLQYRQAITGTQSSISVSGHFQTPIPRVTLQFDRQAADKAYNSFHVDKVDIVPTTK